MTPDPRPPRRRRPPTRGGKPRAPGGAAPDHATLLQRLRRLSPAAAARLRARVEPALLQGSDLLAEGLRRAGVRRVLGIAGTPVDRVFAQCARRGLRIIGTRHQQTAVLAAAAANYVAGRLESAAVVSAGPAVTNTATGLLVARDNGWPVVVLGGRRPLHEQGIGYFQELDAVPMLAPITKSAQTLCSAAGAIERVLAACATAVEGRPGPVYLDLPEDVLTASAGEDREMRYVAPAPPQPAAAAVASAARLLREAQRPLLILGENARWSLDAAGLAAMVDAAGLPFITTPMARGFLPDGHALCANLVRRWVQGQADVVVMAGAWFDWRFRFGGELAPGARVVHADYAGPTLGRNVPPTVAVPGDPGLFLRCLADVGGQGDAPARRRRAEAWVGQVEAAKSQAAAERERWLGRQSRPLAPQQLFLAVRDVLPDNAVVAVEGNVALASAQRVFVVQQPASWLDPGSTGCMGTAIPAALGARLARPDCLAVALCSDMGFALSAPDLETAVRQDIRILAIVANNDGNTGSLRQAQHLPGHGERVWQYQPGLRYDRVMEALGGHAEHVTAPQDLRPALARAMGSGRAACINVAIDPAAPFPGPW